MKYRSIFISDIHLGLKYARVKELIEFLKTTECENLYIVGDLIDGWVLKSHWFWNEDYNLLVQKILRKARKGTKVTYVSGNHDEFLRKFGEINIGNILITDEIIHISPNGKRYLVIHGDIFDGVLNKMTFISHLGNFLYEVILNLNSILNNIRKKFGMRYWSLSYFLKKNTKQAVKYCLGFEKAVIKEIDNRKVDGCITGHIHIPCQKIIDGIEYKNCGCWIEMATALVENYDGTFEILDLDKIEK